MANSPEDIALFDLDGTLCDYDSSLRAEMDRLASPNEPPLVLPLTDKSPRYLWARKDLICSDEQWWVNLPKLQLGWDVLAIATKLGYRQVILTQGPSRNPAAWSGKKIWADKHLGEDFDLTITRDKSLEYGRVLVDDYPGYFEKWLDWRPRGLVIMPVNHTNKNYRPAEAYAGRVVMYDGSNPRQVLHAMRKARHRARKD